MVRRPNSFVHIVYILYIMLNIIGLWLTSIRFFSFCFVKVLRFPDSALPFQHGT